MIEALTGWLLNYLLHSTVLLGGVWSLERAGWLKHPAWREAFWRAAFFGAVLTASVQPLTQVTRIALPDVWAPAQQQGESVATVSDATPTPSVDSEPAPAPMPMPTAAHNPAPSPTPTSTPGEQQAKHITAVAAPLGDIGEESMLRRRELLRDGLAALLLSWPLVALFGLGLTMVRWLGLRRQVRALPTCDDQELRQAAAELAGIAGVRAPTLRVSPHWPSPLVAPGGQICLPERLMRTLDGQQRVAVLAHEIAHLRRHDLVWRLAARLVSQLGWLQPLNRLAMRRLDLLAELACDGWAAAEAGTMPLAEGLYVCARDMAAAAAGRRGTRPMPALASAMAAARSPLMARMDALLEGSSLAGATPARRRLVRVLLAGGLCAVALAVPMLVIGKAPRLNVDLSGVSDMVSSTMTSAMGGKITRHTSIGDGVERRVVYTGDLTFNADETDVESLPGTLTIRESRDGLSRRIEIKADGKGGQIRRYWLNGESTPIDASAQIWLTEQIGLIAESAQGSEPRARRLLTQGGLDAVLADIDKAKEAFVRRSRVEGLLATGPQSDETISRLIALIADMGDDFQRRTALTALLEHRTLGPTQQRELLAAIDGFHGDFERRQVLQAIAPQLSHDASVLDAWQEAVKGIGGDFERRTAIVALLEEGSVDRELSLRVLGAIEGVSGDYERAQMLVALAEHMPGDAELIAKCRQAARGLSMHERGRVEQALDDVTGA